jgi:hypothetical protein
MPNQTKTTDIAAIKGFDKDLACRGFQFEIGGTYDHDGEVTACCNAGFHSCPTDSDHPPHAVFEYYAPGSSRYCAVTASGKTDREGNKIASAKITIGIELTLGEIMARVARWCVQKANGAASNSGLGGAASNSGYGGAASNSGYGGAASNSGEYGAAMSHAPSGRVMCEENGQALYCTEFSVDGSIASVACGITGKKGIMAGVWYTCRAGKLVRA